jgi:hypothetical protein
MTTTTKTTESVSSQMERLDHAVDAELVDIIKDGQDAIAKSDKEIAEKKGRSDV